MTSPGTTRPHTENSGPPFLGLVCSRPNRKPTKGFIQRSEGGPPKTDRMPSHRSLRSHVGFSLFSLSISWKQRGSQVGSGPRRTPTTRRSGPVLTAQEPAPELGIRFHVTARCSGDVWALGGQQRRPSLLCQPPRPPKHMRAAATGQTNSRPVATRTQPGQPRQ